MKYLTVIFLLILPALTAARAGQGGWKFEEHESIGKTFRVATGDNAAQLLVDNVNGWIRVTGTGGSEIVVKVDRDTRAESKEKLAEAKKDVRLDMTQQGDSVKLYADGPFRGHDRGDSSRGYRVTFHYEIQVPAGVRLDLGTLNSAIEVRSTRGDFKVHTLNGKVDMQDVAGAGSAKTLNGSLKVAFRTNPAKESSFQTLNGSIDLYFQPGLDADMGIQTLHGGVFSDFEVTASGAVGSRQMRVRAGKGGPELSVATLNGSIRLHSKAI